MMWVITSFLSIPHNLCEIYFNAINAYRLTIHSNKTSSHIFILSALWVLISKPNNNDNNNNLNISSPKSFYNISNNGIGS
jgi:hypothetical protein